MSFLVLEKPYTDHVFCKEINQEKIINVTELFDLINKIYCDKRINYFIESEFLHRGDISIYSHAQLPEAKESVNIDHNTKLFCRMFTSI